jgi:putative ABC transport system permease protein
MNMSRWSFFRHLPIAWLQLSFGTAKLVAAVLGVVVADMLIWTQLGFYSAAMNSTVVIHRQLLGDLVVVTSETQQLVQAGTFSRRQLIRLESQPGVAEVKPLYFGTGTWRNPWDGQSRGILCIGIDPTNPAARFKNADLGAIEAPDCGLFDVEGRPDFGPVVQSFRDQNRNLYELNRRRIEVAGLFELGAGFAVEGNYLTSDINFLRLFSSRGAGQVSAGVIELQPGVDHEQAKLSIQEALGPYLKVLGREEMIQNEFAFMRRRTPIGFIFTLGTIVGFFVGFAIVYQILYTDVANHLPQFATLKAIGYTHRYLVGVVIKSSLILSVFGYIPGTLVAAGVYWLAWKATNLPMQMTLERGVGIFVATVVMCAGSGLLAVRKLNQADPADVF